MKKSTSAFFALFLIIISCSAQTFNLAGLVMYNPSSLNPAYVGTDEHVQIDLNSSRVAYNLPSGLRDHYISVMTTIPKYNSSLRADFFAENASGTLQYYSGSLAYAYHFNLSDLTKLSGGLTFRHGRTGLEYSILSWNGQIPSDTNNLTMKRNMIECGLAYEYKKLLTGISSSITLPREESFWENDSVASQFITATRYNLFYKIGNQSKISFSPYLVLEYYSSANYKRFATIAGGYVTLFELWNLGFTVGSQYSLSTSFTLFKKISLMLSVSTWMSSSYSFNPSSTLDYHAQIRVVL